jgi:O-antigen/teichoic acid export membrane protein
MNVAKNTVFFISALVIQKILAFGFFIFIARTAGGYSTGDYVGALSFATIFSIFLDLGLSQVLIREVAKKFEQGRNYLNNIISLKIVLAAFVYLLLFSVLQILDILGKSHPDTLMVLIAGVVMVSDSFIMSLHSTFRGYQNLVYESLIIVLSKILIIIVGVAGVKFGFPPYIFIVAILVGSVFSLIISWYFLAKRYKFHFKFQLNKEVLKPFLKMAVPFAILGLFTNIYAQIDVVILSVIQGSEAVGQYSVTSKTLNALQFIPMAFSASLYPAMSRYFVEAKEKLQNVFERGFIYLAAICVPLAVGIFMLAEPIIISAYTEEYRASILALKILAPSLIFAFLTFPVGALLNAGNKQKVNTINMGIIMAINITLNLILVPKMSFIGSAWSWFVTNLAWFILTIYWAGKLIDYSKKLLAINFSKAVLASLFMGTFLFYFRDQLHILINITAGGAVYLAVMFLIKGITTKEIKELITSLKRSGEIKRI